MKDGYGANKSARLKAAREAAVEEIPPLDEEFPYRSLPFDPLFFGAQKEHLQEDHEAIGG